MIAAGRAALATPHHLATAAGRDALVAGGTAVDAAIAAAAMLAVVTPQDCSIGGDLIALVAEPGRAPVVVNGSGAAARAIDVEALRRHGAAMPADGPSTITVPGAVAAWEELHRHGAALPFSTLLEPAIAAAREGVAVEPALARATPFAAEAGDDGLRAVFAPGGVPLAVGDALRQPALARTLEAIAADGARALYGGDVGARLVAGLRALGSPLDGDDLAAHRTELAAPLAGRFHGWDVLTAPPNSQGFVLLEVLGALERLGGTDAATLAHLFRLTSADRDRLLADPRCSPVPVDTLLGTAHLDALADAARRAAALGAAGPRVVGPPAGAGDTVAIVAADGAGRAASVIQSVYGLFGARVLETGTGIVCHNRGAGFSLDASSPNRLEPGKRPAHTLMPVLVARDGRIHLVLGTMGGKAQPQVLAQVLLGALAPEAQLDAVVGAPRWVVGPRDAHDPEGDAVLAEGRVDDAELSALRRSGLEVCVVGDHDDAVGHAQAVRVGRDGGMEAASDPRADGAALVVTDG